MFKLEIEFCAFNEPIYALITTRKTEISRDFYVFPSNFNDNTLNHTLDIDMTVMTESRKQTELKLATVVTKTMR